MDNKIPADFKSNQIYLAWILSLLQRIDMVTEIQIPVLMLEQI